MSNEQKTTRLHEYTDDKNLEKFRGWFYEGRTDHLQRWRDYVAQEYADLVKAKIVEV